jgi:hypothetical protein
MLNPIDFDMMCEGAGRIQADAGHSVAKPTNVYRIEMPNGYGPYNGCGDTQEENLKAYHELDRDGCVRLAKLNHEQMDYTDEPFREAHGPCLYACDSLASLFDWFPLKARTFLNRYSARIVVYQVPAGGHIASVGHGEVIIAKREARKVQTLDILTTDPRGTIASLGSLFVRKARQYAKGN